MTRSSAENCLTTDSGGDYSLDTQMTQSRGSGGQRILLASLLLLATAAQPVLAVTRYVANDGVDGPTCGAIAAPCRSISQAIANAHAGDTINVGPGRYGDLNGNGTFGETGEETAPPACNCMIDIDRKLTLVSRDGALSTILDASGSSLNAVVRIDANATVFGRPKAGFMTLGGNNGVLVPAAVNGGTIAGNFVTGNAGIGFSINGGTITLHDNLAIANVIGFSLNGTGTVMKNNFASLNSNRGFDINGSGHVLNGNIATNNNLIGFGVTLSSATSPVTDFSKNAALANGVSGILVSRQTFTGSASAALHSNNIFANGSLAANCGLSIQNDDGSQSLTVDASGNFWGTAAAAPGPDPADDAGGACNSTAGGAISLTTAPGVAKEVRVKLDLLK